jgi:hypothetical protein
MANQRSKKRNAQIGVFVEPEVKARVEQAARQRNMTVADYIRSLLRAQQDKEKGRKQHDNH